MYLKYLLSTITLIFQVLSQDLNNAIRFQPIPSNLNLNNYNNYDVISQGDFNNDKYMDLILINKKELELKLLLFNSKSKIYEEATGFDIKSEKKILNIMAADWNYDGLLDILMVTENDDKKELELKIILNNHGTGFVEESINLPNSNLIQPFIFDYNGDMKPDLLGYLPNNNQQEEPELVVWLNKAMEEYGKENIQNKENLFEVIKLNKFTLKPKKDNENKIKQEEDKDKEDKDKEMCLFSSPHSNGFIDMDGDCLADLFIVCEEKDSSKKYQIWKNQVTMNDNEASFKLIKSDKLPKNINMIKFSDTLGQGNLDLIYFICDKENCKIKIIYNQQMKLCNLYITTNCRSQENMCIEDENFKLDFNNNNDSNNFEIDIQNIYEQHQDIYPYLKGYNFIKSKTLNYPISINIGDYNLDGYPDLLLILKNKKEETQPIILQSFPCDNKHCNEQQINLNRRYYLPPFKYKNPLLIKDQSIIKVDWFDFFEDGTFDLLLTSIDKSDNLHLTTLVNIYPNDAFFLKTIVSNGVCSNTCEFNQSISPYGVNMIGASIKFTVVDTNGNTRGNMVTQLSQSAYRMSGNPYNLIGLGRTNNYLQMLMVGSSRNRQKKYYTSWSGVIPNSQLIILPYQTDQSTDSWTRVLFINPSQYAKFVLLALIISMAILTILVLLLNWHERREDEKDRKKAIHHINFDAL
ncbi:hypothetical protein K502DRAFT_300520 [Neoconidiobolus thromboides FSU 785]|nr:hypothetical protein K502DRAFT_300520 [Neoconidiobolus thromboides FSU 785]